MDFDDVSVTYGDWPIFRYIRMNSWDFKDFIFQLQVNGSKKHSALNMACQSGDKDMVALLLKHSADPDLAYRNSGDITG